MPNQALVPTDIAARFEVHEWRNGLGILTAAHPEEWQNILDVLRGFTLLRSDILQPGGSKGLIAKKLDVHFTRLGWTEKAFDTCIVVDNSEFAAPTHKVDCYKNRVALEVEWNNKDPFFRPGPEQFPSSVRSPRDRPGHYHHPMHRAAIDLQSAGKRTELW